ncbi:MAG: hypothetical protein ACNS63_00245 [Candidatus Nitrospinota bacterium M3_3B_026]
MRGHGFLLAVALMAAGPLFIWPLAASGEEAGSYSMEEIKSELAGERNILSFNRLSGMLTDVLRLQKQAHAKNGGTRGAKRFLEVEEHLNAAGMFASQSQYDECYERLEAAYETLLAAP